MKKILAFLLSLIIAYTPAMVFASDLSPPQDYRTDSIINEVKKSKYSSATGKDYTVGGVKSNNGTISARVDQRVVVGGSSAEVKTKVSFPVDLKDVAKKATKLARHAGGLYIADKAFQGLMDGVNYVMDPDNNNAIIKKPDDSLAPPTQQLCWSNSSGGGCYSNVDSAANAVCKSHGWGSASVYYNNGSMAYANCAGGNPVTILGNQPNPNYNPSAPPQNTPVSPKEMDDAFLDWFKNNPDSVTDPVKTYIYAPKSAQTGQAQPSSADPSFGPNEITDEMMDNYIRNRDIALNKPGSSFEIGDSAKTETDKTGTTTKTETKPDGSKTTTTTKTEKDPDTGEIVTTVTETTVKPDGTTETKTSTEKTDVKPETKLPPACEYFATLCDWMNWTKEKSETDSEQVEIKDRDFDFSVFRKDRFNVSSQCPVPTSHQITVSGITTSFSFDLTPLCDVLTLARPALIACSYLYAAYIVIGASRNG